MKNPSSSDAPTGEMNWPKRVVTAADAVRFIDAVGYCLLFPIKGLPLPSLYYAAARRVPVTWDKYALKIWDWKSELPHRRRAFYAKYFKGRGTFISVNLLAHFLAMEESAAQPADHARFYAAGRISADSRVLWEALEKHGPLATLELRHACKMETVAGNKRFKKAMLELSRRLLVVHFGVEQETRAWASSRFELTSRAFPESARQARGITPGEARATLAKKYLAWHAGASPQVLARLFRWSKAQAVEAVGDRGLRGE
jgi:hypothetical protein